VLVVDDGINKGDTFRLLINFCRTADVEFLGGMVLDNRLDAAATGDLEGLMGGRPLFALYTWSSKGL
jgi:adenine/guanine phosphoribosyltransferase-like PRPP-binding protein